MNHSVKQWLPMLLCCLPSLVLVAFVGIGSAAFGTSRSGPLGLGLITLALLACPLIIGWMMWRRRQPQAASGHSSLSADTRPQIMACCMPEQAAIDTQAQASGDRLVALRARRVALERELAEMQRT